MNILPLHVRSSSCDVWNLPIGNSLAEGKVSNAKFPGKGNLQVWAGEISKQGVLDPCSNLGLRQDCTNSKN